ncbi:MAG: potassium channel family protein [Nanoarchaeota archaeon]|nr:potassium channel family protein [Nanoarchaeota archaeon]
MGSNNWTKKTVKFYQNTSYAKIFLIWLLIIFIFGNIYYALTTYTSSKLIYRSLDVIQGYEGYLNTIYFSFITTTSLGYGDIAPTGFCKLFAVIEVLIGLVMNGIVIGKFVSSKNEIMLEEIYDITFNEKIDRLRQNFYYDRLNISNLIQKIEDKMITKLNDKRLEIQYINLESHVMDLKEFLAKQSQDKDFVKKLENYRAFLIVKSLGLVLERYNYLYTLLCNKKEDKTLVCRVHYLESVKESIKEISKVVSKFADDKIKKELENIELLLKNI